ncbi:unnamed protein product [Mucor hiemalis]
MNLATMWYRQAANGGDKEAQYKVANILSGVVEYEGVQADPIEAIYYFYQAAKQNCTKSLNALGRTFQQGVGVAIDQKQAFSYYSCAARLGDTEAKYRIGWAYERGLGVEKNIENSLLYLTESAKCNHASARLELAIHYMTGVSVPKDSKMAITLLTNLDFPVAKLCLWYLHINEPTDVQNLEKAKEYWEAVLKVGVANTMIDLGMKYISRKDDHGVYYKKALSWFRCAAERDHGNSEALAIISCMYLPNGSNTFSSLDDEHGNRMKWFIRISNNGHSSERGCVSGLARLGYLYHIGLGVQPNFKKALDIYLSVLRYIDDEDSDANMCLGLLHAKALGVERNEKEAVRYFLRSAKSKHPNTYVFNLLGNAYEKGKGVEVDYNRAMHWYRLGACYHDVNSIVNIWRLDWKEEKEGTKKFLPQPIYDCESNCPNRANFQNAVPLPYPGKPNHYGYSTSGSSLDMKLAAPKNPIPCLYEDKILDA